MPRRSQFQLQTLDDLLRQLRYAPVTARHRLINAAEALVHDLDPSQSYPHEFVIYRITGYRPEQDDGQMYDGAALLPDLATLIARLSEFAPLDEQQRGCRALTVEEVGAALSIAPRTVQRYRKQGLIFHYVRTDDDPAAGPRLGCFEDALEVFRAQHAGRIKRAAQFSQIQPAEAERATEIAEKVRRQHGWSRHRVARHLARQYGRSVETMRLLLVRNDANRIAAGKTPLFDESGPLSSRDARLVERAWRRGVSTARLTGRFGRTAASLHRVINRRRAERLRRISIDPVELPTFRLHDAAAIILAPAAVHRLALPETEQQDLMSLVATARSTPPATASDEEARLAAWHYYRWRAAIAIRTLTDAPGAHELDAIETDLRCASRLAQHLVRTALPIALRRMDAALGRPLEELPRGDVLSLVRRAVGVILEVLTTIDPSRRQHLERVTAYAIDRKLAQHPPPTVATRATARHTAGGHEDEALLRNLMEWDEFLQPASRLRATLHLLDADDAALLRQRYGWDEDSPHTIATLAERHRATATAIARKLRQLEVRLLVRKGNERLEEARRHEGTKARRHEGGVTE